MRTAILTKVGTDPNGALIEQVGSIPLATLRVCVRTTTVVNADRTLLMHPKKGLVAEGVDVAHIVRKEHIKSSFTYVIVDVTNSTRTCINTPIGQDLTPDDIMHVKPTMFRHIHFDSRHTEAAVTLAQAAVAAGVTTSVDLEKDRPHLAELIALVDVIFTNQHFVKAFTGR